MEANHPISQYKVKGADYEEPDGDGVDDGDIGEGGEEEDRPCQEENSSHQIVDQVENPPEHAVFVYLFGWVHFGVGIISNINKIVSANIFNI